MNKQPVVWLIAGTSDGRKLIKALQGQNIQLFVSVATDYGAELVEKQNNMHVLVGRMDEQAMLEFIEEQQPCVVVDATHPYAVVVTDTIKAACHEQKVPYLRLLRDGGDLSDTITVASFQEAAEFLATTEGNIFLTTGSKTLNIFTKIPHFAKRITLRILPLLDSLQMAYAFGYEKSHIICMQGPFSEELNVAMFKQVNAKYVVTKDSGSVGGYDAKKQAAAQAGAQLVVIAREREEQGEKQQDILQDILKKIEEARRC